ncbi:MAG: LysM peptidoglycan-binding domain-containing protein [Candidatus Levybacteria bacterium]|nr:LysM peptidoglycan-binding domain-containing protein [Candidatus Levybacteria bacterium]
MPTAKTIRKTKVIERQTSVKNESKSRFFDYFRFGESYTSLILGMVVVIIASILLLSFAKNKNIVNVSQGPKEISSTKTEAPKPQSTTAENTYTVKQGDSLWSISEQHYKDGYKWVEIAKANNLTNPGIINTGIVLTLPKIEVKTEVATGTASGLSPPSATVVSPESTQKITGNEYTVQKGDYLWAIAIRAYGDGYQWVKIARANKLANPDLIFSGNKLSLPR